MVQQEGKKYVSSTQKNNRELRNYLVFHLIWLKVLLSVAGIQ